MLILGGFEEEVVFLYFYLGLVKNLFLIFFVVINKVIFFELLEKKI